MYVQRVGDTVGGGCPRVHEPGFGLVGICKPGPNLGVPAVQAAYLVGEQAECFRDQEVTPREPFSSHLTGGAGLPKGIWFPVGLPPLLAISRCLELGSRN